ncbi:Uncharacterized protein TCM_017137 [Theobroma cacao]|uniref:Uncharacterized protein n=1 Tax=Theobroma cacao TaxID=3641 RepID=A0A061EDR1_THECC|nr:Uncharacterized protein TCM_017137 [Theobroma cacao]
MCAIKRVISSEKECIQGIDFHYSCSSSILSISFTTKVQLTLFLIIGNIRGKVTIFMFTTLSSLASKKEKTASQVGNSRQSMEGCGHGRKESRSALTRQGRFG